MLPERNNMPDNINEVKPEGTALPDNTGSKNVPDFQLMLDITPDNLQAFLTIVPVGNNPEFAINELKMKLDEKGIRFGVKKELIESLAEKPLFNVKLLIAEGRKPGPAKNGSIDFVKNKSGLTAVKKGEKLADILKPEKGQDGMDVLGQIVFADKPSLARIPNLINVSYSVEEAMLVADIDGYLAVESDSVKVKPFFTMEQVQQEFEADIKVTTRIDRDDFGPDDIITYLQSEGIKFGILREKIEKIFAENIYDIPVVVVKGEPPIDDKDGKIALNFDTEIKPELDANDNVNFKKLNLIQNVKKGEKLASVSEPVQGKQGRNIYGEIVEPRKGAKPELPCGENTSVDPDNPNVVIADIDGAVKIKNGLIHVDPVFLVKGDLDFQTGDIDFIGSVVIKGDVKSGFNVKATGDIEIEGVVEDSLVETDSDILIKLGFIGHGDGKIIAKGNVNAKYCVNQKIICDGDVNISEYIMHSNVQTKGFIYVKDKKGLIVGGESYAYKGIEANILGNDNFLPTMVTTGVDRAASLILKSLREKLWKNAEHISEVNKYLLQAKRRLLIKKEISADKLELFKTLNVIRKKKLEIGQKLGEEIKEIESKAQLCKNSRVVVNGLVHPGTVVTICDKSFKVGDPLKCVCFTHGQEEIEISDIGDQTES